VRRRNEDSFRLAPEIGLAVVADGMGGHPGGDVASDVASEAALAFLRDAAMEAEADARAVEDALARCVLHAHHAVRARARERPALEDMGTTLTVLLLDAAASRWALGHAGDSRAYLLREGTLAQVSHDDTWVQAEVEAGRIPADRLRGHPAGHILRQCVGLETPPDPHHRSGPLGAGDRFLLCSDGLTDMLTDAEIRDALGEPVAEAAARALVERALERGGRDNVTVVLADAEEEAGDGGAEA
jgi:protein phosphatase